MTKNEIIEKLYKLDKTNNPKKNINNNSKEMVERKKRWITFWRNNPDLYIHYKMGFYSFPYQHFSYYLMGEATTYFDVSTRGVGKSLKAITFGVSHMLLFPYARVGVMSVTASQAAEDYETTFKSDVLKNSPFINWLWQNGYITGKQTDKGYRIDCWNGSFMLFFPAIDSSRGAHVDLLIIEEARLIRKNMVDGVGLPMLTLRQPQYKKHHEYLTYKSPFDKLKTIYITSNGFKDEWFNRLFNTTFMGYFKEKYNKHRVFCSDIFVAMKHRLKDENWFNSQKKTMSSVEFQMEILNETIGEAEGAFFSWEQFRQNQVIKKAFVPCTPIEYKTSNNRFRKKKDNEIRLIFADFAFSGSHGVTVNDNTAIGCMSLLPKNGQVFRNVDMIFARSGAENDKTLQDLREIFWDYEADYIVFDIFSGGQLNFNSLTKPWDNPTRNPNDWNRHGFTIASEPWVHQVSESKLDELRTRVVDPEAIPCLIPFAASNQINSDMWKSLSVRLRNREISFLIDEKEYETNLIESKEWYKLSSEEKARYKLPYVYTTLMINEAINLSQEWRNGLLYLKEPREGTKDMIVAMAYGNYIADKIENHINKQEEAKEFDINDYKFIF